MTESDATESELSPRALEALLSPAWAIDATVLGGAYRVDDVYPMHRPTGVGIVFALRGEGRTLEVELTPGGGPAAAPDATAGLRIAWCPPGPSDAGHAACLALAEALRARLGAGPRRWGVPEDVETRVPRAIAEEVEIEEARLGDDPDAALLGVDVAQYERLFGSRPRAVAVRLRGAAPVGLSLHYPAPTNGTQPPSGTLYPVPVRFHRRAFRRRLAALGCALDGAVIRIVPSAATFRAAATALRGDPPPLAPRTVRGTVASMAPITWARRVALRHVLPIPVAPRWAVEIHRGLRRVEAFSKIPVDVGMLAHDISLHAVGLHAIDAGLWARLTEVAAARLRRPSVAEGYRIAEFFEGTLTRTAWDVWGELDAPSSFASAMATREPALLAALRG